MGTADRAYPRSIRIRSRADFKSINRDGLRLSIGALIFRYRKNELGHPRFGLTVSRRVGNAVFRNRVKRYLREALRQQRDQFESYDVVIIAKPSAAGLEHSDFFRLVQQACSKALGSNS